MDFLIMFEWIGFELIEDECYFDFGWDMVL